MNTDKKSKGQKCPEEPLPPHPSLLTLHGYYWDTDEHGFARIIAQEKKKQKDRNIAQQSSAPKD
jgi:hypothetical protein